MQQPKFVVKWAGREETVRLQQGDITRWDMQRAVNHWPPQEEAWNLWSTFVCYNGLRRLGLIDQGMPFDVFVDQVEQITLEDIEEVDPTPPEATPDS
jgi:hypothetical protein